MDCWSKFCQFVNFSIKAEHSSNLSWSLRVLCLSCHKLVAILLDVSDIDSPQGLNHAL